MNIRTASTFCCLLLTLTIAACNSKRDGNTAKEELTSLVLDYYNSLANKDESHIREITAPNFTLFDDGVIYDNTASLNMIRQLPAFKASFKIDSANAHIGKSDASMYYHREAVFTMADSTYPPTLFLESATFLKENDQWKIRFIHSSVRK